MRPFYCVVATDAYYGIAKDGKIPWRSRADMAFFRKLTEGNTVIMGRKTYFSIPKKFRPLPNRTNIVLTRNPEHLKDEPVLVASSLSEAIGLADAQDTVFVIGGESVYNEAIQLRACKGVFLSHIDGHHECDQHLDIHEEFENGEVLDLSAMHDIPKDDLLRGISLILL